MVLFGIGGGAQALSETSRGSFLDAFVSLGACVTAGVPSEGFLDSKTGGKSISFGLDFSVFSFVAPDSKLASRCSKSAFAWL